MSSGVIRPKAAFSFILSKALVPSVSVAEAINCRLVYVFVPEKKIEQVIRDQAQRQGREIRHERRSRIDGFQP